VTGRAAGERALPDAALADVYARVAAAQARVDAAAPATKAARRPVHTLYVPADRLDARTVAQAGAEAGRLLAAHAADATAFAEAFDVAPPDAVKIRERVTAKLATEPVEDLRVDFEDGYGRRDEDEEDAHAARAGADLGALLAAPGSPPFSGLRVKSFADGLAPRSVRTLDVFLGALLAERAGRLPDGFAITLPKVVIADHVAAFAEVLDRLEPRLGLPSGALRFEVQVETPQSVVDGNGDLAPPRLLAAGGARLAGLHVGVFDYTAAIGLPADQQRLDHPALDFARHLLQVSVAGSGVHLSDGSTNAVPASDDRADVVAVWRRHAAHVRHSLAHGYLQGWDLHPAHLPSRFATVFAFHRSGLADRLARLRAWSDRSPVRGVLDEPATVAALRAQLRRGVDCGAVGSSEVADLDLGPGPSATVR
jgi:hypothetical protein